MSKSGGRTQQGFHKRLCKQAWESERQGIRKYYNIYSLVDWAVPFDSGKLTEASDRTLVYTKVGHYGIIALPQTWWWINSKLDPVFGVTSEVICDVGTDLEPATFFS